jgi:hypothetical protein
MTSNSTISHHSLPYWWRVTRYDPKRRDARGAYPRDDWTSIADVGRAFNGVELTIEEYERVEGAYVDAFTAFAEDTGISRLAVRDIEAGDGLQEGEIISVEVARTVVRRLLREAVICHLDEPDGDFVLHIGFDLYMYVGSTASCPRAIRVAEGLGLFVEPGVPSPLWTEQG